MLPIALNRKIDNLFEEQRLLTIFRRVDMTKTFYFPYTYDITSTLQRNLTRRVPTSMGWGLWSALLGTIICLSLRLGRTRAGWLGARGLFLSCTDMSIKQVDLF